MAMLRLWLAQLGRCFARCPMTAPDLARLRELALAAIAAQSGSGDTGLRRMKQIEAFERAAASDPQTILSLLDALAAAERERDALAERAEWLHKALRSRTIQPVWAISLRIRPNGYGSPHLPLLHRGRAGRRGRDLVKEQEVKIRPLV